MTFLALLILGGLWAAVLLPPMIQRVQGLSASRPSKASPVGGFSQNLARLERPGTAPVGGAYGYASPQQKESLRPDSALAAARRRRDVLGSLVAVALFLLVATTMFGAIALYAHIVVDIIAVAFAGLMIRRNKLAAERAEVVTQLPSAASSFFEDAVEDGLEANLSFEDGNAFEGNTVIDLSEARQFRKTS